MDGSLIRPNGSLVRTGYWLLYFIKKKKLNKKYQHAILPLCVNSKLIINLYRDSIEINFLVFTYTTLIITNGVFLRNFFFSSYNEMPFIFSLHRPIFFFRYLEFEVSLQQCSKITLCKVIPKHLVQLFNRFHQIELDFQVIS